MNAVGNSNISPILLQNIVDHSFERMITEILGSIELAVNGDYAELFRLRENHLRHKLSQDDWSIYEHLEALWMEWANEKAEAAIQAGLLIAHRLTLPLHSPGHNSETDENAR